MYLFWAMRSSNPINQYYVIPRVTPVSLLRTFTEPQRLYQGQCTDSCPSIIFVHLYYAQHSHKPSRAKSRHPSYSHGFAYLTHAMHHAELVKSPSSTYAFLGETCLVLLSTLLKSQSWPARIGTKHTNLCTCPRLKGLTIILFSKNLKEGSHRRTFVLFWAPNSFISPMGNKLDTGQHFN